MPRQSLVFGMSDEINAVHRCCLGIEAGSIIHEATSKRPLICGLSPKCTGGQVIPIGFDGGMQSDHGYSAAGTELGEGGAICDRSQLTPKVGRSPKTITDQTIEAITSATGIA
jgi:hypothetical protein